MQILTQFFSKLWSISDFNNKELSQFAREQLIEETRQGLKVMSTLLILLILTAMLLFKQLGQISGYSMNYFWVMALAAHINVSARIVKDIRTLHALGVTMLVISATAYVFIAHQAGEFSPLLMANIVLLFMVTPMVPWGLREAVAVVIAIYLLLTLSVWSGDNHFSSDTFRVLQFFLLAAGATSLVLVVRSIMVRKKELQTHFELQKAHADLYQLSNIDPLTGAWNRRYLDLAVAQLINVFKQKYDQFHFIIFDLNEFKILNDSFGHDFGDQVLILTSHTFIDGLGKKGYLIRIGGDEFIVIMVDSDPEQFMNTTTQRLQHDIAQMQSQAKFGLCWGRVTLPMVPLDDLEVVYQQADKALYEHKQHNRHQTPLGL